MLSKAHRLRSSTRIQQVKASGCSWHNHCLVLIRSANASGVSRFAFSVSRRVGKAVTRNRLRRRLSEVIRQRLSLIRGGWDIVLVARVPLRDATYGQIEHAVLGLLRRSDLLIQDPSSQAPSSTEEVAPSVAPSNGGIQRPPRAESTTPTWPR